MGLAEHDRFNNLIYRADKDPESVTLFEAKAFHALHKAYKKAGLETLWLRDACNPERLDTLAWALTCFKADDDIRKELSERSSAAKLAVRVVLPTPPLGFTTAIFIMATP